MIKNSKNLSTQSSKNQSFQGKKSYKGDKSELKSLLKSRKIIAASAFVLLVLLFIAWMQNAPHAISVAKFNDLLVQGAINEAVLQGDEIIIRANGEKFTLPAQALNLHALAQNVPISIKREFSPFLIITILAIFVAIFVFLKAKKPTLPIIKAPQSPINQGENLSSIKPVISSVSFEDVAGVDDVKIELGEIVDFLKNPKKYAEFGVKMPKGVLMVGPPGVGKTLIAKAVAGEAGVPFFYQSGSAFVEIYVGMGAKRVRELFSRAKMMAPSIIFIDEIDALGGARSELSNAERDSTLNQLLTQMDGFEDNSGVIVIAATNKIELMDPALLRSGRFDRRIFLSLPDFKDRLKILEIYMRGKKNTTNLAQIAKSSVGFSGAALETLVNEAAINALRRGGSEVCEEDFYAVLDKVLLGKKKILSFSEDEKKIQATYQAAKAMSAYYYDIGFEKITLTEDRFSEFERHIKSRSSLLNRLKVHLAGACAMRLVFGENFTNSQGDIMAARELLGYMMSFEMANESTLMEQKQEIEDFLNAMKDKIEKLSTLLLEQEKLEMSDVAGILRDEILKTGH